jgi:hypothetical protein
VHAVETTSARLNAGSRNHYRKGLLPEMRVSAVLAASAKAHIQFRYGVRHAAASTTSSASSASSAAPKTAGSAAAGSSSSPAAATEVTLRRALTETEIAAVNSGIAWV